MSGGKQTPRQKMIGMMYLVLTALLALNISKSILDAFIMIDDSLVETNQNFKVKNDKTYADFAEAFANDSAKVSKYMVKVRELNNISVEVSDFIKQIKSEIMVASGGFDEDIIEETGDYIPVNKDDTNGPSEVLILKKRGNELQEMILKSRKTLLSFIDESDRKKITISLDAQDPIPGEGIDGSPSWASHKFEDLPLTPVMALLSQVELDMKNAEADILNYLYRNIDKASHKVDMLAPKVIPRSSFIMLGQKFVADVFLAAYSSTQTPKILAGHLDNSGNLIGDSTVLSVEAGMGKFETTPTKEGTYIWGGVINVKDPVTHENIPYEFQSEYIVAKPFASVSPTKMNVLYVGIDNPLAITAPGFPKDKVTAYMSPPNGTFNGRSGEFNVNPYSTGNTEIIVTAELDDGTKQVMGRFPFRIATVPDPVAMVANKSGGRISGSVLGVQKGMFAVLEDFYFELQFNISRYTMYYIPKRSGGIRTEDGVGPLFTTSMENIFDNLRSGDKVLFMDIWARGPDRRPRELNPITFVIK